MNLYQLLDEKSIKVFLESKTKNEVLSELTNLLCESHNISQFDDILKGIMERETAMTTGIGNGIAVPHCKSAVVGELVAALGISREGIDFNSPDNEPARIFFILVAEENNPGPHVKALAKLARLLRSSELRDELVRANTAAEVLNAIRSREENL